MEGDQGRSNEAGGMLTPQPTGGGVVLRRELNDESRTGHRRHDVLPGEFTATRAATAPHARLRPPRAAMHNPAPGTRRFITRHDARRDRRWRFACRIASVLEH